MIEGGIVREVNRRWRERERHREFVREGGTHTHTQILCGREGDG